MTDNKHIDNDPERTLITLEQLSQTIEVMTSVVNRLRQHLSEQLKAQIESEQHLEQTSQETEKQPPTEAKQKAGKAQPPTQIDQQRESFVVEIKRQETEPVRKSSKILH
jgi:hypothetical protein